MALRQVQRGEAFGGIVEAAEEGERLVVERLQAERDAVDTGTCQRREVGRFN